MAMRSNRVWAKEKIGRYRTLDSIESKGKTVDEAIFNGLQTLGVGIDEVEIDILHEGSKGLFGIGKSALVKLTVREEPVFSASVEEEKPAEEQREANRDGRSRGERRERPERGERRERTDRRDRPERAERHDRPEPPKREPIKAEDLPAGADEPQKFLNGLFELMEIDAHCDVVGVDEKNLMLDIAGKDTAVLIGRRGDTLDALQYLTGLVINRGREDYRKVMLDAENYRFKREVTLEKLARRLASNVSKSGKPVTLEPMNPYERRILHATLQSNPRVETYSEGEEPYRRVVIRRKKREN